MKTDTLFWLAVGGLALLTLGGGALAVYNTMWKQEGAGPQWLPALNAAEVRHGIPTDLLARMASQESHFRPDIILGSTVSPAGALGLMQLLPQYFASVRVARPFTPADTLAQIEEAAGELVRLYGVFGDWQLAVAAYNDGQGNVQKFLAGTQDLPAETYAYLHDVFGDVPV
jgi:soluble lytic murein transglycosylase-like protein